MASVCINNVGISPEKFRDCPSVQPAHARLSPRLSFSRDLTDDGGKKDGVKSDQEDSARDMVDFEFRLNDPVTMISADELFSNGKLVPLHLVPSHPAGEPQMGIRSLHSRRRGEKTLGPDQMYSFSPRPPSCSSVWKELFGLKKAQSTEAESQKATSASASASSKASNSKSLKHLLRLNSRSPSSDTAPQSFLLRDSDSESVSISARASLSSSSSSGADHDELPRFSLDSEKIAPLPQCRNPSRARVAKARPSVLRRPSELPADGNNVAMRTGFSSTRWASESETEGHAAFRAGHALLCPLPESDDLLSPLRSLVESPRLNASGKVIFQGLGRSSSSPNIIDGRPQSRPHGMVRSQSANLMFTPVLNVRVRSLRGTAKPASVSGFGQLLSHSKREKEGSSSAKNGHQQLEFRHQNNMREIAARD